MRTLFLKPQLSAPRSPARGVSAPTCDGRPSSAQPVGKRLDPHFDVYSCVTPFLMQAMEKYPTGKKPRRGIPREHGGARAEAVRDGE
jgi:hypothetical protein